MRDVGSATVPCSSNTVLSKKLKPQWKQTVKCESSYYEIYTSLFSRLIFQWGK